MPRRPPEASLNMKNDPPPVSHPKIRARLSGLLKAAVKLEYLPFTILVILCAISLVSRIVLLLR